MSDAPETPVPAPSEGMLARLATKFGIRSESEIVAEMKAESAALLQAGNEAQAELETTKAALAVIQGNLDSASNTLNAINLAVPGITASADPKAFFTSAVTTAAQEQIAASGFKPGEAPAVDANAGDGPTAITSAEFAKLSFEARNEHVRKGGKVSE